MSIPTFYHPQLLESDSSVEMSAEESAHAVKSRRLRAGQKIRLFNGRGLVASAKMSSINRSSVQVSIIQCRQFNKNENNVSVLTAIPKGDRQRFMVDALCQLGVHQIIPLNCEHSVTRFTDKIAKKWQRFAIEACKQSQNAWLPVIGEQQYLDKWLAQRNSSETRLLFAHADGEIPKNLVNTEVKNQQSSVCIGPEGGFSAHEIDSFKAAGGIPISLSENILRTETAAIASMLLLRQ